MNFAIAFIAPRRISLPAVNLFPPRFSAVSLTLCLCLARYRFSDSVAARFAVACKSDILMRRISKAVAKCRRFTEQELYALGADFDRSAEMAGMRQFSIIFPSHLLLRI